MKAEFWHERWEANQLGFHQATVNELLSSWWSALNLQPGSPVFVPLCGKSLDMTWLRAAGHPVLGVEISPIAIRDFFAETKVVPARSDDDCLEKSTGGGYTLYCGDFFDLTARQLSGVRAVYDRASLIALPPETRRAYARHLSQILPAEAQILLITVDYDQTRMKGPPHSVPPSEVRELFSNDFEIELLWSSGETAPTDRFRERGLESWSESIWRLHREPKSRSSRCPPLDSK